jgi:hypothetical protein
MESFKNLVEFIGKDHKHFYNRDIKCPVCGNIMCYDNTTKDYHGTLYLICTSKCCKMEIPIEDYIIWGDKLKIITDL